MTPRQAFDKAMITGKRLPELEHIIMTDSWASYFYSNYIIKGRWIEAEDIIMTKIVESYFYARDVIKGKLPEKMHNMMILHAIQDLKDDYWGLKNDFWAKEYFELIK